MQCSALPIKYHSERPQSIRYHAKRVRTQRSHATILPTSFCRPTKRFRSPRTTMYLNVKRSTNSELPRYQTCTSRNTQKRSNLLQRITRMSSSRSKQTRTRNHSNQAPTRVQYQQSVPRTQRFPKLRVRKALSTRHTRIRSQRTALLPTHSARAYHPTKVPSARLRQ